MIITSSKHILLVPAPSWGHLRPLASFAARLVHQRPDVIVTLTLMGSSQKMLENEIDRYFHDNEKPLKDNIRLLHIGGSEIKNPIQAFEEYTQGFAKMYPAAYAGEPLTCNLGRVFPGTSRPNVILLDNFFYDILQTVRKISGNSVPVLAWNTAALSSTFRFFGPPSLGGLGDVPPKAQTLAKETGKPLSEIYAQLYQPELGEIVKLPGLPEMYDYEFGNQHLDPQIVAFQCLTFPKVFDFFEQCDGIVALGNASFEPDVCAAFKTWFSPRPIYFVGPLLPDETPTKDTLSSSHEKELSVSSNGAEVKDFLDRIQKSHGDHSLLYVSFGSNFFPMGETIWKVIEVVLDMKIPLIFSFNPKKGEMPSHIQEQLKVTEIALVSNWAPQHAILAHNATGWFLTHCGNNSINEAASHGVPMIAWPLGGDQPSNAAYLSSTTNTAYELFETRLGVGLRPLYRGIKPKGTVEAVEEEVRSVFAKAWGADGAEKRKNAQALKKKLDVAWEENGEARVELVKFLDKFIPAN